MNTNDMKKRDPTNPDDDGIAPCDIQMSCVLVYRVRQQTTDGVAYHSGQENT